MSERKADRGGRAFFGRQVSLVEPSGQGVAWVGVHDVPMPMSRTPRPPQGTIFLASRLR